MSAPAAITVVVADDQTAVREALAELLDLEPDIDVVAVAADGAEAVRVAQMHRPDVVLMDLRMPGTDGVEATAQLSERLPDTAVVVLTTFADEDSILAALGAGARGYLTKDASSTDIARAVRGAAAGQAVLDHAVQDRLMRTVLNALAAGGGAGTHHLPENLTGRELEVLTLIGQGMSNRAIARKLIIGEATVKTHINNLFAKAQLTDRSEAVRLALTAGLA